MASGGFVVALKLTLEIGDNDEGGWWFNVADGNGEPYAAGSYTTYKSALHFAEPFMNDLATEEPLVQEGPTSEEYAAQVARAKAEHGQSEDSKRFGMR